MSSITKSWVEEDFRKELRRLDEMVRRSQGINLVDAELDIEFSRARCTLGMYYPKEKKFIVLAEVWKNDTSKKQ